jgi:hypothetical protein
MFSNFLKVLGIQGEQQQQQGGAQPASTKPTPKPTQAPSKSVAAQLNEDEEEELPPTSPQKELKTYKGEDQEDSDLFVETTPSSTAPSPPVSSTKKGPAARRGQPDLFKEEEKEDEESWLFLETQKSRLSVMYARPEFSTEEGNSLSYFSLQFFLSSRRPIQTQRISFFSSSSSSFFFFFSFSFFLSSVPSICNFSSFTPLFLFL